MTIDQFQAYCLAKPAVTESMPFDDTALVYKVGSKIFALIGLDSFPMQFNAKCEPEKAIALREMHPQITPGYHMNKKHWNSIVFEGLSKTLLQNLIDDSYQLVVAGMTKKEREALGL
jgi:predicted DNA-binding protein (MmcQ/YjbR family)